MTTTKQRKEHRRFISIFRVETKSKFEEKSRWNYRRESGRSLQRCSILLENWLVNYSLTQPEKHEEITKEMRIRREHQRSMIFLWPSRSDLSPIWKDKAIMNIDHSSRYILVITMTLNHRHFYFTLRDFLPNFLENINEIIDERCSTILLLESLFSIVLFDVELYRLESEDQQRFRCLKISSNIVEILLKKFLLPKPFSVIRRFDWEIYRSKPENKEEIN